ncbi:MAG: peptidyl-prolyl cis-trans isomerase [Cytophagaceae bacterium]|jgi:parvulin-like peptidyl-prolyl isomerase|nr:peptidyl-prolyl cis-trans isomerase [Cytophagaceae bacterium]
MGVFNKINQRSGLVVGFIAIGLLLFLLGNEFFGPNSIIFRNQNNVGEINGTSIDGVDYQNAVAREEAEYQLQSGKGVTESERQYMQQQAWNKLIFQHVYKEEFNDLGLVITDDEKFDMVQGNFIHSYIKSAFGGEQQGFNKAMVTQFLGNFDQVDQTTQVKWHLIEQQAQEARLREKFTNLLKKSEYVTKAEAKKLFHAQSDKANVDYVFVPYSSIPDSTVEVSDDDLKDYISEHKEEYKVEAGRSLVYAVFDVTPTYKDSIVIKQEIQKLLVDFKQTDNDTVFIENNSNAPALPAFQTASQLAPALSERLSSLQKDSVYGPYSDGANYSLYKIIKVDSDTNFSVRASHILLRAEAQTPEAKAVAKQKAQDVLNKIKGGADFAEMAKTYGTDGTSTRGGDLGWFGKGQMVGAFEKACFAPSSPGLLPNLVETEFGYHIIKVTQAKTNKKFLVGTVVFNIEPSEETTDSIYTKADNFAATVKDTAAFAAEVLKLSVRGKVQKYDQKNVGQNDPGLSALQNARELIRWAYNDAKLGQVSNVFTIDNKFVIAILTGKRDKGTASVDDVREEVKRKVLIEKKGELISKKLKDLSGSFADIAKNYGPQAQTGTASDVTIASAIISSVGYDPIAAGNVFGLKQGVASKPIIGENGVCLVKPVLITVATEPTDYTSVSTQALGSRTNRVDYQSDEALKFFADIKDERYKRY